MILTPEQIEELIERRRTVGLHGLEAIALDNVIDTLKDSERRRKLAEESLSILAGGEKYRRAVTRDPNTDIEDAEWHGWGPSMAYAIAENPTEAENAK